MTDYKGYIPKAHHKKAPREVDSHAGGLGYGYGRPQSHKNKLDNHLEERERVRHLIRKELADVVHGAGFWSDFKQGFDSAFERTKPFTSWVPFFNKGVETLQNATGGPKLGLLGTGRGGARKNDSSVGNKNEVWNGTKERTSGGLTKKDLMKNKRGKVVSKKQHELGQKAFKNIANI